MHAYRVYIIVLLISMDCQLADMERKCGIQSRWKKSDREYVEAKHIFLRVTISSPMLMWGVVYA